VRIGRHGIALMEGGSSIDSHWLSTVRVAAVEPDVVIARHIPFAAHNIVNVLAESWRVGSLGVTNPETELIESHKVSPFEHLLELSEGGRKDDTADRVSVSVSTVGIQFTTLVTVRDVQQGQVSDASDLNVVGGNHPVSASDRAIWNKSCTGATLDTPRHFNLLGVTNGRLSPGLRGSP